MNTMCCVSFVIIYMYVYILFICLSEKPELINVMSSDVTLLQLHTNINMC